jgi:hypothetical protein
MAARLLVANSSAEKDAAREVEARVFLDAFGNTAEDLEREYGPYAARSRFVAVIDEWDGTALGAGRLIVPDEAGELKTLSDVTGSPWHLSVPDVLREARLAGRPVWDVATLAVDRKSHRGALGAEIMPALCYGLVQYSLLSAADGFVTVLDDRVLRLLRAMGLPWDAMAGATSQSYLGSSASTPCICHIAAIPDGIRARRPDLAPAMADGAFRSIALDPADLLPHRGAPLPEVATNGWQDPPSFVPRDTTDWRPPASRRSAPLSPGGPARSGRAGR